MLFENPVSAVVCRGVRQARRHRRNPRTV